MADGSLIFDTQIDSTGISRFANIAKTGFAAVATGAVAAGTALTAAGTYAVGLASNLAEVQNVVDTTFGKSADVVNSWAKSAAESFGMSELQAKQFNGTMGAMLKSMQLSDDEVLGMSTSLSGLAGDFASFYNLDTQEAFDKIRSGISGETEPLKQLGINMSVANLEAYALSEGISKAYNEMTQAEQATLRYNYLMSVSSDAQGDFAKTSDSLANQLRILKLNVSDAAAEIGNDLMPMVQDGVSMLNGMIDDLSAAYQTGGMDGLASEIGNALGKIVTEITNATPAIIEASVSIIENLVKSLGDNADTITQAVTAVLSNLIEGLTGMLPELIQATMNLAKGLAESIAKEAPELIPQVVSNVIDTITTVLTNDIDDIVEAGMNLLDGLMQGLIKATPMLIEAVPDIIMKIAKAFVEGVGQLIISANEMAEQTSNAMSESMGEDTGMFNNIGVEIGGAILAGIFLGLEDFGEQWTAYWKKYGSEQYYKDIFGNEYGISDEMRKQQADAEKALEEAQAELKSKNEETLTYMQGQSDKAMDIATTAITQVNSIFGSVGNGLTSISKQASEAITDNTEDLKTAWEQAQHDYAIGVITSEEELYAKKLELWQLYGDESNKDHWNYFEDIKGMEQNFAADSIKQAEETAKKQQEEQEKLTAEIKKEKQKQLDIIKDNFKKQLDIAKDSINQTITAYKSQFDTINGYADDYKSKLLDVGDVFTVTTETDEQGNQKTTYAVENMEKQIKAMEEYNADIKQLKEQGASQALLSEVTGMGFEEGSNFADYLDKMSDEEFKKINTLYNQRQQTAEELSQDLYADELETIKNGFFAELETELNAMPEVARQAGQDSINAFVGGLTLSDDTSFEGVSQYFEAYTETAQTAIDNISLDEAVKTSLSDADMAALGLTAGQQFTDGFNKAFEEMSLKLTAGVQADRANTAAAMTANTANYSTAATTKTAANENFNVNIDLTTQTNLDGEKIAVSTTRYQRKFNRQRGQ